MNRGDLDFGILQRLGELTLYPTSSPKEIPQRISTAHIVLSNKAFLDAQAIAQAPHLQMIAVCATGTNNVDLKAAKERGIRVTNVAGYGTQTVAQHTMTFILNWATQTHRFVHEPETWAKSPIFTRLDYPVTDLAGKNLGLVGTGRIGNAVGNLATAFGMIVKAWGRQGITKTDSLWPRLTLKELFEASDVISLHCPLTDETRHIINRESLTWMKQGAFLVNTGRGDLIDELALKDTLLSGKLDGAGLDVLSIEPPPPNHPLLHLKHPNLMITPHTAWTSKEARTRLFQEVTANIEAFLQGKSRNVVV